MKLIEREHYLNKLLAVRDIPDIKIITGVRRSGKSKLMDAFIDKISIDDNVNVVRIKLNLKKYESLLNADELYSYLRVERSSRRLREKKSRKILSNSAE